MAIPGKNINDFKADLKKFSDSIGVSYETAFKKIILEAYTRIVMRSPVDTGRFRSSWTIQEISPNEAVQAPGHYPTPPRPDPPSLSSPYTIVWINNSLPYAVPLETGWSKQAPQGMVAITAAELAEYINTIAKT
jgi:hypothetical protein